MHIEMKSFSDIVIEITGGVNPICTVKQIAKVMRVHEQTVYDYKNDRTEPSYSKIMDLSHYLIQKHDYYVLGIQGLLPCNGGTVNGSVDDESLTIAEGVFEARKAFNKSDGNAFHNGIGKIKAAIKNLEAEGQKKGL